MAYDEGLAHRVEEVLGDRPRLVAKKMFGGIGYMLNGNMAVGVNSEGLIVRVGPDNHETALAKPHTKEFGPAGRSMNGWVLVVSDGLGDDYDLSVWVEQGVDFALSLPPK